jgi:ribosomal protein S18 acetylase RimI-like enzyme
VTPPRPQIGHATIAEARAIATLMSHAFHADPVSGWLMPAPGDRRLRHPGFFRVFIDRTLMFGEIYLHYTDAYNGAALWLDVDPDDTLQTDEDIYALEEALGPGMFERFHILHKLMHQHHPIGVRHAYLQFIAVTPARQRGGIGRALIEHKLAQLDKTKVPAYLEATTDSSRRLYERLGFRRLGDGFTLPNGGPHVAPMWRSAPAQHGDADGR